MVIEIRDDLPPVPEDDFTEEETWGYFADAFPEEFEDDEDAVGKTDSPVTE